MAQYSGSFTARPKPKDSVSYTLIPDKSILTEGETETGVALYKTIGASVPTLITPSDCGTEITVLGATANGEKFRFYKAGGVVYGESYIITAKKSDNEIARTTIGVTTKGDKGDTGDSVMDNIFGYDCFIRTNILSDEVYHTATGLVAAVTIQHDGYGYVNIFQGLQPFRQGQKIAMRCKVRVEDIDSKLKTIPVHWIMGSGSAAPLVGKTLTIGGSNVEFSMKGAFVQTYQLFLDLYANGIDKYHPTSIYEGKKLLVIVSDLKIEDATTLQGMGTAWTGLSDATLPVGDNLLTGTRNLDYGWYDMPNGGVDNNYGKARIINMGRETMVLECTSPNNKWLAYARHKVTLKPNTTYTGSFYAIADTIIGNNINVGITGFTNNQKGLLMLDCNSVEYRDANDSWLGVREHYIRTYLNGTGATGEWQRHTFTFRTGSDIDGNLELVFYNHPSYVAEKGRITYITAPKLEEGDLATDWLPAPGDQIDRSTTTHYWSKCFDKSMWFYTETELEDGSIRLNDVMIDDVTKGTDGLPTNDHYLCIKSYYHTADTDSSKNSPANDKVHWEKMNKKENIATDFLTSDRITTRVLEAVNARIDELVVRHLRTDSNKCYITLEQGLMKVFGTANVANIVFGVNDDGMAVLSYYDNDNRKLYELGPSGILDDVEGKQPSWTRLTMRYIGTSAPSAGSDVGGFNDTNAYGTYYRWHTGYKGIGELRRYSDPMSPTNYNQTSPSEYDKKVFVDGTYQSNTSPVYHTLAPNGYYRITKQAIRSNMSQNSSSSTGYIQIARILNGNITYLLFNLNTQGQIAGADAPM